MPWVMDGGQWSWMQDRPQAAVYPASNVTDNTGGYAVPMYSSTFAQPNTIYSIDTSSLNIDSTSWPSLSDASWTYTGAAADTIRWQVYGPVVTGRTWWAGSSWISSPDYVPETISQEEADRRLAATRAQQHRNAVRRKRAVKKGRGLLVKLLSETQKWEYAKKQSFTVCGADGEWYVLRKGGTVHQLGADGEPEFSHCIHLPYSYIDEDTLIALKLMLETDPANFHRVANTTRLRKSSANVSNLPLDMQERAAALAGGVNEVNNHLARLGEAARRATGAFNDFGARIRDAAQYAEYARELEGQVVAEGTGLALPLRAQQEYTARALGHAETIGGDPVEYDAQALEALCA